MNTGMAFLHKPGNHCKDQLPIGRGVVVVQPQGFEAQTPSHASTSKLACPQQGETPMMSRNGRSHSQTKIFLNEHKVHEPSINSLHITPACIHHHFNWWTLPPCLPSPTWAPRRNQFASTVMSSSFLECFGQHLSVLFLFGLPQSLNLQQYLSESPGFALTITNPPQDFKRTIRIKSLFFFCGTYTWYIDMHVKMYL